ncbi:TPA: hypothetical protein R1932_001910 [Staphylococcus delphini]|nr:hypothetical protein [Staphylococcus delphini]
MANVAIKLEINNEMSEQEKLMFKSDNIADVITMIRSKSGNTIILKNEDSFKVEYDMMRGNQYDL